MTKHGETALHCASMKGNFVAANYLLDIGFFFYFSLFSLFFSFLSFLSFFFSFLFFLSLFKRYSFILKKRNKKGADPNSTTEMGETALHYAIRVPSKELVKLLLDHGANPTIQSISGFPKVCFLFFSILSLSLSLSLFTTHYRFFLIFQKKKVIFKIFCIVTIIVIFDLFSFLIHFLGEYRRWQYSINNGKSWTY